MCWLRSVCYTCTDVSSIPHIVVLENMYIVMRVVVFRCLLVALCIIALCRMFFTPPLLKLLCKQPCTRRDFFFFLPDTVVLCESFYFLPSYESWRGGTKLVSVSVWSHNKANWRIFTFDSEAGEMRRVLFFNFSLCSTLQQTTVFIFLLYLRSMVLIWRYNET